MKILMIGHQTWIGKYLYHYFFKEKVNCSTYSITHDSSIDELLYNIKLFETTHLIFIFDAQVINSTLIPEQVSCWNRWQNDSANCKLIDICRKKKIIVTVIEPCYQYNKKQDQNFKPIFESLPNNQHKFSSIISDVCWVKLVSLLHIITPICITNNFDPFNYIIQLTNKNPNEYNTINLISIDRLCIAINSLLEKSIQACFYIIQKGEISDEEIINKYKTFIDPKYTNYNRINNFSLIHLTLPSYRNIFTIVDLPIEGCLIECLKEMQYLLKRDNLI